MERKLNEDYWWELYEDGSCIDNKKCKYQKTNCAISANARYYDKLGKNIQLGKEIQLKKYKSQIIKFVKTFVSKMKEKAKDCSEKQKISNGERKIIPNAFVDAFKELLNNVIPSIKTTEILTEKSNVLPKYNYIKRKPVDIMIKKNPLVFIEFKTVLSYNDFGAALFESIITNKGHNGKFYILTIGFPKNYKLFKKIIKEPFFKKIDGVFGLVPDGINEFCDLLASIKSLYK